MLTDFLVIVYIVRTYGIKTSEGRSEDLRMTELGRPRGDLRQRFREEPRNKWGSGRSTTTISPPSVAFAAATLSKRTRDSCRRLAEPLRGFVQPARRLEARKGRHWFLLSSVFGSHFFWEDRRRMRAPVGQGEGWIRPRLALAASPVGHRKINRLSIIPGQTPKSIASLG